MPDNHRSIQHRYPTELRDRGVRMVLDEFERSGERHGVVTRIAAQLGVGTESLRKWVKQAEVDGGRRPGTSTSDQERIAALEREVRELRRANEILKAASVNSTGRCNYPFELSGWSDEAERLAGPAVQLERDAVEVFLAMS